ncbi:MAG: aminoglycoside phosphotransferase family protein [Anaerolineae bacterium]|jgi:hypothetical protein|nr:aminoglycoside phosphotransferase family protein [Anaerolineae bacterium]
MMEVLAGGREGKITRVEGKVHRPAGAWTPHVHALLRHVRTQGFTGVPEPFGFDADGNEVVSYIAGEVSNYPLSPNARSVNALVSSAKLLRAYHEATVSFVKGLKGDEPWFLPALEPVEVMCHGDYAPYNIVLDGDHAIAIIDFDVAHPGPRVWDIAYALYRFAPLTGSSNADGFGNIAEQISRCRLFCDAYGLPDEERVGLIDGVIERLQVLVDTMQAGAAAGNEAFQANIAEGHHRLYLGDIEYLQENGERIQAEL